MSFFNLEQKLFERDVSIPDGTDVVFVSDMFVEDYIGGAELTFEALIESCPLAVFKLHSKDVTMELLEKGFQKHWIFGNFAQMDYKLIPSICANLNYSIIECDYKLCKYRSIAKHEDAERASCNCHNEQNGKLISAFMYAAKSLWWMSEGQMSIYHSLFPFLAEKKNTVLSSVFNDETFAYIKVLRERYKDVERKEYIVCGSSSWIKGTADAVRWCEENGKEYEVVWNLPYHELLEKLAKAEGLVFLPKGDDTCPRLVIEARLLGCKLQLNEHVQHRDEIWFDTDDMFDTEAYLYLSRDRFWNGIKADMSYQPTVSGYTTTFNCISQDYPFEECIASMLGFCDEVVVVDGGSTDGTWERLSDIAANEPRLVIHRQARDWSHPRSAVFDGRQKALARSLCTKDFCWQMDSDEVVHEDDGKRVRDLTRQLPKGVQLLALPVVEYWGSTEKVRFDVNLWKWRLSRNMPGITHGIPRELRRFDTDGELFSTQGSDGCDYIRSDTYERVQFVTFYTADVEQLRQRAFTQPAAREQLEAWFNDVLKQLPVVQHFSWFNITRKVRTYRDFWSRHWCSLFNIKLDDTAENNMFFDRRWSDVSDDEIDALALRLKDETGGWVFHRRIDFNRPTPHLRCGIKQPAMMEQWMRRNS